MNRIECPLVPHPAAPAPAAGPDQAARRRRSAIAERLVAVTGSFAAAALLLGLVQTCEESVRKGEQLRAVQRLASLPAPAETAVR